MQRLQEVVKDTPGQVLRLSVDSGGCSGMQYRFDLDGSSDTSDTCATS